MSARNYPVVAGFTANLWTHRTHAELERRGVSSETIAYVEGELARHGLWIGMEADPPEPMPDAMKQQAAEAAPQSVEPRASKRKPRDEAQPAATESDTI